MADPRVKVTTEAEPREPASLPASMTTSDTFMVTSRSGLEIKIKKPAAWSQFEFVEALGGNPAPAFLNMCMPLLYVVEIAGEMALMPSSRAQVQALVERLGEDGIAAVTEGIVEHFIPVNDWPDETPEQRARKAAKINAMIAANGGLSADELRLKN